jgi:hypothetical protein
MSDPVEWASLASDLVVVASGEGRWFLHRPSTMVAADPFSVPMAEDGTRATTTGLLEGAVWAGISAPAGTSSPPVQLTREALIHSLVSSYHTTRRTPATFRIAARRAAALGRVDVAQFLERKARDESGHDRLALQDLRELGLPAERLVEHLKPGTALALANFFEASAREDEPAGCLGYTYCLERLALLRGAAHLEEVRRVSPAGANTTRFLRVHSSLGSDAGHVESLIDFIADLPASERTLIARTAYRTAALMATHIAQDPATIDTTINRALECVAGDQPSESSTARALRRSAVSNPSVNQS